MNQTFIPTGGSIAQWLATCFRFLLRPVGFSAFPSFFGGKIINVAQVNQQRWLEESERWPENVDLTYLVRGTGLWQASITKILT